MKFYFMTGTWFNVMLQSLSTSNYNFVEKKYLHNTITWAPVEIFARGLALPKSPHKKKNTLIVKKRLP